MSIFIVTSVICGGLFPFYWKNIVDFYYNLKNSENNIITIDPPYYFIVESQRKPNSYFLLNKIEICLNDSGIVCDENGNLIFPPSSIPSETESIEIGENGHVMCHYKFKNENTWETVGVLDIVKIKKNINIKKWHSYEEIEKNGKIDMPGFNGFIKLKNYKFKIKSLKVIEDY